MMAPVRMIKRHARAYLLSISKEWLRMRSQDKQRMQREERVFIGDLLFKGRNLIARKAVSIRTAQSLVSPGFVDNRLLTMSEI